MALCNCRDAAKFAVLASGFPNSERLVAVADDRCFLNTLFYLMLFIPKKLCNNEIKIFLNCLLLLHILDCMLFCLLVPRFVLFHKSFHNHVNLHLSGTTSSGDVAIDDVRMLDSNCPLPGHCDFETGFCGYFNQPNTADNMDWLRDNGHAVTTGGNAPPFDHTLGKRLLRLTIGVSKRPWSPIFSACLVILCSAKRRPKQKKNSCSPEMKHFASTKMLRWLRHWV